MLYRYAVYMNETRKWKSQGLLYVRRASKGGNVKNLISVSSGSDAGKVTSSATGVSLFPSGD